MSTNENHSDIEVLIIFWCFCFFCKYLFIIYQEELAENKKNLLNKLSTIFDLETANDFVSPKTFEPRKHLTVEDLKHGNKFYLNSRIIN